MGRSMIKNLNIARNLGYADVDDGTLVKPSELDELPDTRSPCCARARRASRCRRSRASRTADHRQVQIERGDTVIMSAKPVPGNELAVHDTMNALTRRGARVLHQDNEAVHVSGHGSAEELKMMLALVHPRAFMPVHGELRMLAAHAEPGRVRRRAVRPHLRLRQRRRARARARLRAARGRSRGRRHVRRRPRHRRPQGRRPARPPPALRRRHADRRLPAPPRPLARRARGDRPRLRARGRRRRRRAARRGASAAQA